MTPTGNGSNHSQELNGNTEDVFHSWNVNYNSDQLCGIGCFKPRWIQRFADARVYLVLFCLIGIVQGAYFTYFIGILSTLERRYAFDSQVTGIILIADNLGPALCGIFVGYYGKLAHRPRLVTTGMMIVVLSCMFSCLPYVIYGSAMHTLEESVTPKRSLQNLCLNSLKNECELGKEHGTTCAVPILFFANFLNGFGSMAYYTVGTPYMDDNVKKKESPLYLGFVYALRIVGPTFGFMLSSFCLKYYENPFVDPGFSNDDPRWIGAWWMGFPVLGAALFIFSFPIALFPRSLESTEHSPKCDGDGQHHPATASQKGFFASLKRLFWNPILVLHTISITFQINGIFGYYVFMPKYMESQYQKTASSASFYSGTISLLTTVGAIFLGGVIIRRFKPRPRLLTGYMVFVELFAALGLISALFLGCPSLGVSNNDVSRKDVLSDCNRECDCSKTAYTPVCDLNGTVYFSPCFGGCSAYNVTAKVFHNCSCIAMQNENVYTSGGLSAKFCMENCHMFLPYFVVLSISKIFASTVRVANVLVTLRCVDEQDKTFALGAVEFIISIFATIPYPLIYGHVIDTTCLVWEESCGRRGNCWTYDREKFRHYLHSLSLVFILIGFLCDTGVFYYSKRLTNFYGKETKTKIEAMHLEGEADEVHALSNANTTDPQARSMT